MKLNTLLATAALAASAVAVPAHAGFYVSGGEIGSIPGASASNEFISTFLGAGTSIEGWYGSQLYLTGTSDITVEIFGTEATFKDGFLFEGNSFYTPVSTGSGGNFLDVDPDGLGAEDAKASDLYSGVLSGLLGFSFTINGGAGPVNGFNFPFIEGVEQPNFFITFDDNYTFDTTTGNGTASSGNTVFLFLDDNGAGPDDNHDDLVVRLTAREVPEPASLGLLGMGLVGLGMARRRRKA